MSLYNNPGYRSAAPFSSYTLTAIKTANPDQPTVKPAPYTGSQFVAIPEFQRIGDAVGQIFAAAVVGQIERDAGPRLGERNDLEGDDASPLRQAAVKSLAICARATSPWVSLLRSPPFRRLGRQEGL